MNKIMETAAERFQRWLLDVDPEGLAAVLWDRDVASKGVDVEEELVRSGSWFVDNRGRPTVWTADGMWWEFLEEPEPRWRSFQQMIDEEQWPRQEMVVLEMRKTLQGINTRISELDMDRRGRRRGFRR